MFAPLTRSISSKLMVLKLKNSMSQQYLVMISLSYSGFFFTLSILVMKSNS